MINCLVKKCHFLPFVVVCVFDFAACSFDDNAVDFLEIQSVSGCISDKISLADFEKNAVKLYANDHGTQIIEFPAMWYGREPVNEIKSSYSGDTLKVALHKKMTAAPGFNCPVWVKAEVHGNIDAKYLYVNTETFEL